MATMTVPGLGDQSETRAVLGEWAASCRHSLVVTTPALTRNAILGYVMISPQHRDKTSMKWKNFQFLRRMRLSVLCA
jgi:hypothetical protein